MKGFSYIKGDVVATQIDGAVAIAVVRPEAGSIDRITPDELDGFCAAWIAYRCDAQQFDTIARLLKTWGESPQGVRYRRYGEP